MYNAFHEGDTIKLWCDGKETDDSHKRKNDKMKEPKSKKEKSDQLEADICAELEENEYNEYTAPQYTLWVKLTRSGHHDSYDELSPIPLIIGGKEKSHKKESMSDVMVGAATALAHALKTPTAAGSPTPVTPTSTATYSHQHNKANICHKCLEDLHILSQVFNDGVLMESEFIEQNHSILACLRNLN